MDARLLRQHLELEESHWWFVGRRSIVLSALERGLEHKKGLNILDAGCGGGATLASLSRYGCAQGMELSEEAVDYARQRGREVSRGSIESAPFASEGFDLALALDVIEHVPDDLAALGELYRVLRPGGSVLVTVPAFEALWSAHDVANGHYRRYTLPGLRERVETSGFEVVNATYFNALLFPPILAVRRIKNLLRSSERSSECSSEKGESDIAELPRPLNGLLAGIFSSEARLVGRYRPPFGVSALCLARKPRKERPR